MQKISNLGKDIKKELSLCNNVIYDLPADNALRKQLVDMKSELEDEVDATLGSHPIVAHSIYNIFVISCNHIFLYIVSFTYDFIHAISDYVESNQTSGSMLWLMMMWMICVTASLPRLGTCFKSR